MRGGEGVQTRHGIVIDDSVCLENTSGPKPTEERACKGPLCEGIWVYLKINNVNTTIWLCMFNYLLHSVYHPVVLEKVYSIEMYFVCTVE